MSLLRRILGTARKQHLATPASAPPEVPAAHGGHVSASAPHAVVTEAAGLARTGRFAEAHDAIERALRDSPGDVELLFAEGTVLLDSGRFRQARAAYEKVLAGGLDSPVLRVQLGWSCFQAGDVDAAIDHADHAIASDPLVPSAHFCRGVVLKSLDRTAEAAASLQRAIKLRNDDFDAWLMLGNCRLEQKDATAAESCFRAAIAVAPDRAAAWSNLGFALRRQDRLAEAVDAFERAYRLDHGDEGEVGAYFNLAVGYADVGRTDEALRLLETNLPQYPIPDAYFNYGLLLLGAGRLQEAWPHHEFRWLTKALAADRPVYGKPAWTGQPLAQRTVLIRAEQGLGDTIQFLRYARALKARGATVWLKVPPELEEVGRQTAGIDRVLPHGETALDFDFFVHTMSLPAAFETSLATIPAEVPYIAVDSARRDKWRGRLARTAPLQVGLAWAGSPGHDRDRYRSISFQMLSPLLALDRVRFVSLQKGAAARDLEGIALPPDLVNVGPELDDFADTAAVIDDLDLVVCVDTAVAHLAGALGKPVWVMLPTPGDWRWMDGRDDSPWYPTMRLFRQRQRGDWAEVIARVAAALRAWRPPNDARAMPPAPSGGVAAGVADQMPSAVAGPSPEANYSAVAQTRHGFLQYLPSEPLEGRALAWYGEYLEPQMNLLSRLAGRGATVAEIGAGVGAHATALSRIVGEEGSVIAYETRAVHLRILRQNVRTNSLNNVTVLPSGATTEPSGPALANIDALRLDRLDLLKLGPSVAAFDVLTGAEQSLWRLRPVLFAAVTNEAESTSLAQHVKQFGYRCWRMETPLHHPNNFNRRDADVFDGRVTLALLAVPEETETDAIPETCIELAP